MLSKTTVRQGKFNFAVCWCLHWRSAPCVCFLRKLNFFFAFLPTTAPSPPVLPPPLMKHLERGQETIYNRPKVTPNKHSKSSQPLLWLQMKSAASWLLGLTDGGLSARLLLEPMWQKPRQLWAVGGSCFNLLPVQAEQSDIGREDGGISSCCYFAARQPYRVWVCVCVHMHELEMSVCSARMCQGGMNWRCPCAMHSCVCVHMCMCICRGQTLGVPIV